GTGTLASNYNLPTSASGAGQITPADVTATAGNGSNVYDGATHAPSACVVSGAYIGGLSCVNSPASVGPGVGTTVISPVTSGADLANFTVTPVDGSYTIDPALVTATAGSGSTTYDGATHSPSLCAVSGAYTGDLTCANNPASVGPNAGTTTINALVSGTGLGNFNIAYVAGSYTIDQRLATWTTTSASKTYGDSDPIGLTTGSGSNFVAADNVTATYSRVAGENASPPTYHITATLSATGDLNNYIITNAGAEFTINKATVTVTPNSGQSKVYGTGDPNLTYTASGLTNGDTVSVFSGALARAAGANVGTYAITLGTLSAGGNYNTVLSATPVTFEITQRAITVTAVTSTKIYDGNTSSSGIPTVTSGSIVSGDTGNFTQTFDTPLVGTGKTLTVSGSVSDGNGGNNYLVTFATVSTGVITTGYCFNGFFAPIGGSVETLNGGSFADPVRAFKLGSTIPVKFAISSWNGTTCGAPVFTGIHTLQAIKYSNSVDSDPAIDATPTDAATTGNQFRLTDSEWHFNLSTKGGGPAGFTAGTWLLKATLQDGSIHTVWITIKK
ncbi:MAG TPA: MBG domain-containing protein, partial [Pyrinomonadaceae bacterium]